MNFLEAVATGLPYRRKGHHEWIDPDEHLIHSSRKADIIADDYEVKLPEEKHD